MIVNKDKAMLAAVLAEYPLNHTPVGSSVSREHFGDHKSIGCNLRRTGRKYDFTSDTPEQDTEAFGVYFGQVHDKWTVVIKHLMTFEPIGFVAYDTLAALKEEWELD